MKPIDTMFGKYTKKLLQGRLHYDLVNRHCGPQLFQILPPTFEKNKLFFRF